MCRRTEIITTFRVYNALELFLLTFFSSSRKPCPLSVRYSSVPLKKLNAQQLLKMSLFILSYEGMG
jgi:hypothetical protein